ncbi:MAG: FAD-binding protein [Candidatus Bathyarchaeia archaeon]
MDKLEHDVIILGGGAAGLRAAIAAAKYNPFHSYYPALSVAVVSKTYPMRSHTVSAEGGLGAVLKESDSYDSHAFDTIKGSDFLADQDAVEFFVKEAPKEIVQLEHWGCPFSRDPDGKLSVRWFGGMSVKRTFFASDKIGFHLLHTLFQTCLKQDNIIFYNEWYATSLLVAQDRVYGVLALDLKTGELNAILGKAVIIATGGAGKIYEFTTNGAIKTGDGMALAYRVGVPLKDMEFVQYHPTALPGTGILMTEAARGEGGYLINKDGERFLKRYVPQKMELGPRDNLSRAIMTEIKDGRAIDGPYGQFVHLDLRHLGKETIEKKLPFVKELSTQYAGINPVREPIPVRPGVHYVMGGVHTDKKGFTGLAGLYAAGEAACVGINGANRLGSNSLTECLVFGAEAGKASGEFAWQKKSEVPAISVTEAGQAMEKRLFDDLLGKESGKMNVADIRIELQKTMENNVGIYRAEQGLAAGCRILKDLKQRFREVSAGDKDPLFNTELISILELECMLDVAETIATTALSRQESRGSHSRLDYPVRRDEKFLTHSTASYTKEAPEINYVPVNITRWQPAERVY